MDICSRIMEAIKTTFQEIKVEMQNTQEKYIQELNIARQGRYIMQPSWMNTIKKHMLGMILRPIVMIGIWIVVISGMTTTLFLHGTLVLQLFQHYGPHLSMGPWYMVVHPHNKR
jgi:hypothetical protein